MTANSFITEISSVRDRKGYGNKAISLGFDFAYLQEFFKSEFFKSSDNKIIDEELFILETVGNGTFDLQESITLLARFFCGIQVFEKLKDLGKNRLFDLKFKDLSSRVTDKMLNDKIKYVKQVLKMDQSDLQVGLCLREDF